MLPLPCVISNLAFVILIDSLADGITHPPVIEGSGIRCDLIGNTNTKPDDLLAYVVQLSLAETGLEAVLLVHSNFYSKFVELFVDSLEAVVHQMPIF